MQQGEIIKVLIGGESGYVRLVMRDILAAEEGIEVVATAHDGEDLFEKAQWYHPDVIVLDIDLPRNVRFLPLKRLLTNRAIPLIFSGTKARLENLDLLNSIDSTAYALLIQPDSVLQRELRSVADELVLKVKQMAAAQIKNGWLEPAETSTAFGTLKTYSRTPSHLVVIGASTGGAQAVEYILRELPQEFTGAVLVAQHMPSGFTSTFTRRLNAVSALTVEEGIPGQSIEKGQVIISPGDAHMTVATRMGNRSHLCVEHFLGEHEAHDMPSIDILMQSAAKLYKEKTIGILLSGLGRDGVKGLGAIKALGGLTIAQDESSSAVFGMPKAAIEEGNVNLVLTLADISRQIRTETGQLK